jgi:hypothetical protein
MIQKFASHTISILFIGLVFILIQTFVSSSDSNTSSRYEHSLKRYTQLNFLDLTNPKDRILLREALDFFEPQHTLKHDTLLIEIESYLDKRLNQTARTKINTQNITTEKITEIVTMMFKFFVIYLLVLLVTYYGVETFAIYRFIRFQQGYSFLTRILKAVDRINSSKTIIDKIKSIIRLSETIVKAVLKAIIYLTLFAPAYVIAYSFKPSFDTSSILLMVVLGVISNGLLATYTQKYFTFLVQESKKGYVQTAIVKNLHRSFRFTDKDGITPGSIFRIKKQFSGHIFDQIFENVRIQYLKTLKEQASFLISGLIIIEMALNIQGHLCYELMQQILYKNLAIVLIIIFGIFMIVKITEIVIDYIVQRHMRHIDN